MTPNGREQKVIYITSSLLHQLKPITSAFKEFTKYIEREYSLDNPIFSAEAATLSPVVFKQTPTVDIKKKPPKGPPRQIFLYLVFN